MTPTEETALRLINAFRRSRSLTTLMPHPELERVAYRQSVVMRDRHFFDHRDFPQRIGNHWQKAGEVIFRADLPIDSAKRAVDSWIESPHHRENLLGDYQFIGISRVTSEKQAFWTADFGS